MNHRILLALAFGLHMLAAHAGQTCMATPAGTLCTAQVNFARFYQTAYQTQQATEWCWAASVSMVFAYYGHSVSQARIVEEAYGSVVNMPGSPQALDQSLDRTWTDDAGVTFHSTLEGVFDAVNGIQTLNNNTLIAQLAQDKPFIVGTAGHAMVVTEMSYYQTAVGPSVVDIGVFDPWPWNPAARSLSLAEATPVEQGGSMSYIATAEVNDGSGAVISYPFGSTSGNGGGAFDISLFVILGAGIILLPRRRAWSRLQELGA